MAIPSTAAVSKPRLGLIGGVGCGKSFIAGLFAKRGARVIDGDRLGHEALKQPEIRAEVVRRWGQALLDAGGEIDRKNLAAIVFADAQARKELEELVFPWIRRRMFEQIEAAQADPATPVIVIDAAVMLESGWDHGLNWLVFIDVPEATRKERAARERGWSAAEVERRERAQLPLEEKRRRAHYVIDNGGTPEDAESQVAALWRKLGLPSSAVQPALGAG
jgi:dephospho-CoA kinase